MSTTMKTSGRRRGKKASGSSDSAAAVVVKKAASPPVFEYLEAMVAGKLGINVRKLAKMRVHLVKGGDWEKRGTGYWWTKNAVETAVQALGLPLTLIFPKNGAQPLSAAKTAPPPAEPNPWKPATVVNTKVTNPFLILAEIDGTVEKVQVGRDWRERFRPGMQIEAQKSPSGLWRTRKPRFFGKF